MAPLVTASVINPIPGNGVIRRTIHRSRIVENRHRGWLQTPCRPIEFEARLDKGRDRRLHGRLEPRAHRTTLPGTARPREALPGHTPQTTVVFIETRVQRVTAGYRSTPRRISAAEYATRLTILTASRRPPLRDGASVRRDAKDQKDAAPYDDLQGSFTRRDSRRRDRPYPRIASSSRFAGGRNM